jgi:GntR family transcriptional regulator, transcriptional repressor for pyruvate dehydrogenase complex
MLVSDQVFRALLEAVLEGRYAPGEKLPTQRALAADLDVTMSSLREALKRLEQMGLIEVRHGDAMRVRDWRAHGGLDVVAHLVLRSGAVDPGVLHDVLEARELMLRELARLAAERRDNAEAERLRDLAASFAATDDPAAAQAVDFAFFSAVAEAARNIVFVLILNAIRDAYFEHAERVPVTADPRALAPRYTRLAEAIAARDAETAGATAFALAAQQTAWVREALRGGASP